MYRQMVFTFIISRTVWRNMSNKNIFIVISNITHNQMTYFCNLWTVSRSRKVTTLMATQARAQLWGQELRVELYRAVASGETSRGTRATATLETDCYLSFWLALRAVCLSAFPAVIKFKILRLLFIVLSCLPPAAQTPTPAPGAATARTETSGRWWPGQQILHHWYSLIVISIKRKMIIKYEGSVAWTPHSRLASGEKWAQNELGWQLSWRDNSRGHKLPDTRREHPIISSSADASEASNQHQGYVEHPDQEREDDELTHHNEDEVVGIVVQQIGLVPAEPVPGVEHHQALIQHPDCLTQKENHTQKQNLCSFKIPSSAKWYNKKFFELIPNFLLQKI